jgi:hypothetical protein
MVKVVYWGAESKPPGAPGDRPGDAPRAPHRHEATTAAKPTGADVAKLIAPDYSPGVHTVSLASDDRGVMVWSRTYDGVDMMLEPRTAQSGDVWLTRWKAELAEPERVRRAAVISEETAARRAGLVQENSDGHVKARLLYYAELVQLPLRSNPTNAVDVEQVVRSYRLVLQLKAGSDTVYVDAYTGEVVQRASSLIN